MIDFESVSAMIQRLKAHRSSTGNDASKLIAEQYAEIERLRNEIETMRSERRETEQQ